MKEKLEKILGGEWDNHILPFFWQHGEDDETLLNELHKIYDSGIRAICVESRPHEKFGKAEWFEDMHLIISECKKLGMEFWLLDDAHFPTGYANGDIKNLHPELGKHAVSERHTDVVGPYEDCAVMINRFGGEDKLIGVVARERVPGDGQKMTGRSIDLTARIEDDLVFFDVPEGYWRVFVIFDTPIKDNYIDMLRKDSVQVLIDAVYEPHYRELGEYFGTTFRGYFSDEPFIMREARLPIGDECNSGGRYPWNDNVRELLTSKLGEDWLKMLPDLWFPSETAAKTRIGYMDTVTELYRSCFSYSLGDWSRAHGVEYIGHIVEDDDQHSALRNSAGHYFRSLDGQDMAGIDVVLCQIVPGMSNNTNNCPCSYDIADHEFFHYSLAKLGASHSHIQSEKKGRAMCEIYGAYGWAEGLPMMKWLTDHMLVRGINYYVPHAFTPKYPDYDCPPHFYAAGHNPEYRGFRKIMDYMNRVTTILSDGVHHAACGLLYHAEAEWSGGRYMKMDKISKILTQAQTDFDIISEDYLAKAQVADGKFMLGGESYPAFVVPYAEILPEAVMNDLHRLADGGVDVIFVGGYPTKTENGGSINVSGFRTVELDKIAGALSDYADILVSGENTEWLRSYHYSKNGTDVYMLTNEGVRQTVYGKVEFAVHNGGEYVRYNPFTNTAYKYSGEIKIELEPYSSEMFFFGDIPDVPYAEEKKELTAVDADIKEWKISYCPAEDYDPIGTFPLSGFTGEHTVAKLFNAARENTKISGFIKYETELELDEGTYEIDLGHVGECAYIWVNGKYCGEYVIPPYRTTFEAVKGKNILTVVTTSHLAYAKRDGLSQFLMLEPVGLLGPVELYK